MPMTASEPSVISISAMIKRLINRSKDYLFALPAVERSRIDRLKGKVSCLLYHRVEAYGKHAFLDEGGSPVISESDFERELAYLRRLPTKFYTLSDLSRGEFPDGDTIGIVICFDDGFKCNYEQGIRLLNKHGIKAVFFQCSGFIDAQTLNWEHLLYWLDHNSHTHHPLLERLSHSCKKTNLGTKPASFFREIVDSNIIEKQTWALADELGLHSQIADIARHLYPDSQMIIKAFKQGFEIASHGHHHYKRDTVSDELFITDLKQSKDTLSGITGQQTFSYSYPFNSYFSTDHEKVSHYFSRIANVAHGRIHQPVSENSGIIPRLNWPGISPNQFRMKRWLLTGEF